MRGTRSLWLPTSLAFGFAFLYVPIVLLVIYSFNGSKLVLLETRGDQVVKRLFATAQTGDILDLDVIPMTPDGKTETLHFQRVLAAGSGAH